MQVLVFFFYFVTPELNDGLSSELEATCIISCIVATTHLKLAGHEF